MNPDFTIPSGDNPTVQGEANALGDITGWSITFSAKKGTNPNTLPLFTITAVVTNGPAGLFYIPFTSLETTQTEDIYNYDLKFVDTQGNVMHTQRSVFEISQSITA